jgi:hypothetical protein
MLAHGMHFFFWNLVRDFFYGNGGGLVIDEV